MTILYSDADIVAVDKPAGVAAHASVGLDRAHGARRTGRGRLPHHHLRCATNARASCTRLDVGTSGVMVVAISERAYTVLKRAFKAAHRRQALSRAGPGPPGSVQRHHRRADRAAPAATTGSSPSPSGGRHSITHYDTVEAFVGRQPARRPPGNRSHTPDPGALLGAAPSVLRRPDLRCRSDAGEAARAGAPMAARAVAGLRASCRRSAHRDHQPVSGRSAARARRAAPPRIVTGYAGSRAPAGRACCSASGAFVWWGLCPGFFPLLLPAGSLEVLAHRIVWSAVCLLVVLVVARRLGDLTQAPRADVAPTAGRVGAHLDQLGDLHMRRDPRPRRRRGAGLLHQPAGHRRPRRARLSRAHRAVAADRAGARGGRGGDADRRGGCAALHRGRRSR